jgi:hypothetical protein
MAGTHSWTGAPEFGPWSDGVDFTTRQVPQQQQEQEQEQQQQQRQAQQRPQQSSSSFGQQEEEEDEGEGEGGLGPGPVGGGTASSRSGLLGGGGWLLGAAVAQRLVVYRSPVVARRGLG